MKPRCIPALVLLYTGCTSSDPSNGKSDGSGTDTSETSTTSTTDTTSTSTSTSTSSTPTVPLVDMTIAADDPNIRYTGRWDLSDPTAPWAGWQGASILVTFHGTEITAQLDPGQSEEWFRVIVDGDHFASTKLRAPLGINDLVLATGLSNEPHTIELVKETYKGTNATFHGFTVLSPSIGLVANPPEPSKRIVFYGDSNLAGDSVEHEQNNASWEFRGSHFTLAGNAARMLDAAYQNISTSGETISGANNRHDRTDWWDPSSLYDFTRFPADLVVVNLGANDVWRPEQQIRRDYEDLLDDLRIAHPDAHIVLFNGYGWDYDETANYTHEVAADYGDPDLSVAIFPWVFEQWHGCEYDHAGMAVILADHVAATLGWPVGDSGVMSGFGVAGDVANGSFEEIAPFGGYGWRYAFAPGVQRIQDPANAQDGDHFVELTDGADIHQPNPASDGDTVSATVWLRAANDGEEARLTVDFRDQEMWTNPLASTPLDVVLTTAWQPYVIEATAPVAGPRPVFHTRLTISAGAGATVSVDAIEMTTQP